MELRALRHHRRNEVREGLLGHADRNQQTIRLKDGLQTAWKYRLAQAPIQYQMSCSTGEATATVILFEFECEGNRSEPRNSRWKGLRIYS